MKSKKEETEKEIAPSVEGSTGKGKERKRGTFIWIGGEGIGARIFFGLLVFFLAGDRDTTLVNRQPRPASLFLSLFYLRDPQVS